MLTLISTLLQLAALFIYWPLASLLRALCFWRTVPKSRRLGHSPSSAEASRF
jgi:hypothetical protein